MPPKKAAAAESASSRAARFGRVKSSLKMGIVGLPNVGKSSLFNLMCEMNAAAENFPFCTIEPNESQCVVPDERYDYLCGVWNPPSKHPSHLQVMDIAGLVRGAAEGAGLGNAFLSHIQAVDGIFHVVRAFESEASINFSMQPYLLSFFAPHFRARAQFSQEVVHVEDSVDPVRDLETIQNELCKKDLAFLDTAEAKEAKDVKCTPGYKLSLVFTETVAKCRALLQANKPIRDGEWSSPEVFFILGHFD